MELKNLKELKRVYDLNKDDLEADELETLAEIDYVLQLIIDGVAGQSEQLVCEYCNEDAKPTCCDACLDDMVKAVQKAN